MEDCKNECDPAGHFNQQEGSYQFGDCRRDQADLIEKVKDDEGIECGEPSAIDEAAENDHGGDECRGFDGGREEPGGAGVSKATSSERTRAVAIGEAKTRVASASWGVSWHHFRMRR